MDSSKILNKFFST